MKRYGTGLRDYARTVTKPVAGSVVIKVAGNSVSAFTVNLTAGIVTFNPGSIPAPGAAITAGFEFDVPVRFDTDQLRINLAQFAAGDIPDIQVVEIRA